MNAPESLFEARRLHGKYHGLRRTSDDSLVGDWHFVLIPYNESRGQYDPAAIAALTAYADACEGYQPELADDLRKAAQNFRDGHYLQRLYMQEWER